MAEDFRQSSAPHFRQSDTQFSTTVHRISALFILLIFPLLHYGARVILMVMFGVLSAVAVEFIWRIASKQTSTIDDLTAVEIGLTCALMIPTSAHYQLVIFAATAAVAVGKMPFGGSFRTPFVPAAVGYCMSAVCFPEETFTYSQIDSGGAAKLFAFTTDGVITEYSPLAMLRRGEASTPLLNEYLLGEVPGPLGTTSVLLLIIAAIWLFMGGNLAWQCVISFSLADVVTSFSIPYQNMESFAYIFCDLLGGSTFFCCVFMSAYPNYCPKLATARYIWGAACGFLAVMIQHFGSTEAGGAFSVLIMTPFAGAFDQMVWYFRSRGISYKSMKKSAKRSLDYHMKTRQERELDEIQ